MLEKKETIESSSDGKNTIIKQEVLIDEKSQDKVIDAVADTQEPQALPAPQPQTKSDKEIDLEILREQNRAKELEIELKKLEVVEKSDLAKKIIDDNHLWFDHKRADVIDALGDRDRDENL